MVAQFIYLFIKIYNFTTTFIAHISYELLMKLIINDRTEIVYVFMKFKLHKCCYKHKIIQLFTIY